MFVGVFPRYQGVQRRLTQQQSELQDAGMLTEFLERVELEESQEQRLVQVGHLKAHFTHFEERHSMMPV